MSPQSRQKQRITQLVRTPRTPRRKFTTNSDNTMIHSRYVGGFPLVVASGAFSAYTTEFVNPAQTNDLDPGLAIARNFSNYVVTKYSVTYSPAVGTTTLGTVFMGYIDNPEIIYKIVSGAYTPIQSAQLAQACQVSVSGPVWQQLTLNVNKPPRRKMFSIDRSAMTNTLDADRIHQGLIITSYFGPTATSNLTLGYIAPNYSAKLENPQAAFVSGV